MKVFDNCYIGRAAPLLLTNLLQVSDNCSKRIFNDESPKSSALYIQSLQPDHVLVLCSRFVVIWAPCPLIDNI